MALYTANVCINPPLGPTLVDDEILIRNVKTTVIPKLDYSKGIPEESKTMVVIPTIVANTAKIKEMFDILESFYLVNKTENLYFTLLGDVKAGQEKVMPFDEEVSKYGREYAEKLNAKYKKDIFYFIYRKRLWNEKENCYLGYERKRGALLQFNKILLGEKIDENKYFNVNMLKGNKLDIKYVITLDTDTKLVLNSALNLVGAMAHPMNKPIFNKEKTKVFSKVPKFIARIWNSRAIELLIKKPVNFTVKSFKYIGKGIKKCFVQIVESNWKTVQHFVLFVGTD